MKIRTGTYSDTPLIAELYLAAFPDEDLLPLVKEMLRMEAGVMHLVAEQDNHVIGHVSFTDCGVNGSNDRGSLLAPLAVAPGHQRSGIGTALVREGLRLLDEQGVSQVFVLGDPAYYSRFDFAAETSVSAPYDIPDEWAGAWQSLTLGGRAPLGAGRIQLPELWMRRELWAP